MKKILFIFVILLSVGIAHGQNVYNKYGPANGIQKNTGSTYQNTSAATADIVALLPDFYATSYGVRADGVTDDSIALNNAATACNAAGGRLWLPAGNILLAGASTVTLNHCAMYGTGATGGDSTGFPYGTTVSLISTTVKPFIIEAGVTIYGINFYWPNNVTPAGNVPIVYPPLFSDGGSGPTQFNHDVIDNIAILNAYDGMSTTTGLSSGDVKISNSTLWAYHNLFTINATGDSWALANNRYTPGPVLNVCNFSVNCEATINTGIAQNAVFHIATGSDVGIMSIGGAAFGWRYFILVDAGAILAQSSFEGTAFDGIATLVDSSSGGSYPIQNTFGGRMTTCSTHNYGGSDSGNAPCFKLGTNSSLFLHDFYVDGSRGSFIEATSNNTIFLDNIDLGGIGAAADGGDYYAVKLGTATNSIKIKNSRLFGKSSDAHIHGINIGTNTVGSPDAAVIQNVNFGNFNDVITGATNNPLTILGCSSTGTNSGGSSVNVTGTGTAIYANNNWDVAETALPSKVTVGYKTTYPFAQSGLPMVLPPSGFFANNGVLVIGQAPSNSATVSFSATSGSGVTMTFSAATLLGTAADVNRVLTILDTTYKFATITAQSSTTVATVTLTGTLSGTGPFANNSIWLSGTPTTNTVSFSVPLATAYANAYLYFPANAIVSGSAAGFYFCQMAATTKGTCFNNIYSSGVPVIPASPTAFSTTGPGAYSQTTASNLTAAAISIPGGYMGINGEISVKTAHAQNNSANTKTYQVSYGVQQCAMNQTTATGATIDCNIRNAGSATAQSSMGVFTAAAISTTLARSAQDSGTTRNLNINLQLNSNAFDYTTLEGYSVRVTPSN